MNRRRLGIAVAALTFGLTAACGGGDGSDAGPPKKAQAPLTLDDFKASPDQRTAGFEPPADLAVSDPSWDRSLDDLTTSLTGMMAASFTDRNVWRSSTDGRTYGLVFGKFTAIEDQGDSVARAVIAQSRQDKDNVGRLGYGVGSTFPADAQPRDSFIFKTSWRAKVKGDRLTVEALAWSGYDTGGRQPVLFARKFKISVERTGGTGLSYRVGTPAWTGEFATCRAVVDGVLAPADERPSTAAIDAYKAEFADPRFRTLQKAMTTIAAVDGDTVSEAATDKRARKCLAEAKAKPSPKP